MRRTFVVMFIAFGVLLTGLALTGSLADASSPAQQGPEKAVVFESLMRGA